MTIVPTRRRRRLDLIVVSLCAVAIVVVVVIVVARRAFAIIVDFVARRAAAIVVVVVVSRCAIARRAYCRLHRPLRRRHRLCSSQSSSSLSPVAPSPIAPLPSSFSSLPVAIVVVVVSCRAVARRRRHLRPRPSRRHHHRLRINTGTPHFHLGIPISVWGSPNQNGDPRTEMGMRITKNPQTYSGIPEPKGGSIHPHTNPGIPESVWGMFSHEPESVWGLFQFGTLGFCPQIGMAFKTGTPYRNRNLRIGLGTIGIIQYSKSGSPRIGLGSIPIWGPTEIPQKLDKTPTNISL